MKTYACAWKKTGARFSWIAGLTVLVAVGFNNCAKVAVWELEEASLARINSGAAVIINNDAPFTNTKQVSLSLFNNSAVEMYITNDPKCEGGGEWEPYAESKPWVLDKENSSAQVYAKFRETHSGVESGCYEDAIVHDDLPPVLMVVDKAPSFTNKSQTQVRFSASDALSGLENLSCTDSSGSVLPACQEDLSIANSAEGPLSVTIRARDKAGNVSQPLTESWVYDRTPPQVILNQTPSAVTNSTNATFDFSGKDNLSSTLTYECKFDGQSFTSCSAPHAGTLGSGNHTFQVQAKDQAGNVSAPASYAWQIDQSAPTVVITSAPSPFSNSSNAAFSFSGSDSGQPLARFECQIDNGAFGPCQSPKSHSLPEGSHVFQVRGYDSAGNVSSPAKYSWTIDLTRPSVQITSHPASITKDRAATFTFTVKDDLSGISATECSLNNGAFVKCDGSVSYTTTVLGTNKFSVRTIDRAGNQSSPIVYNWLIDQTAPVLQITSGPPALTKDASARLVMQVTDNSGVKPTIQCRIDKETAYSVCSETKDYSSLAEGPHTFYARAVDAAGNQSSEATYSWTADLKGPAIIFNRVPLQKISTFDEAQLEYTVTDSQSGVDSVSCGLGSPSSTCPITKIERFSNLAAGKYTYVVTAKDRIGHSTTNSVSWSVEDTSRLVTESITVKTNNKVDVLVVIDNSGSMNPEQQNMAQRFSTFFDKLAGLDWQLGIITTDVSADTPKKDGRFLEFSGMAGKFILNSSMDLTAAKTAFSATIQRPANEGHFAEQGVGASYRAIQRSKDPAKPENAPNVAFFRDQSALTILVVSDANETNQYGTQTQNIPQNLINLVQSSYPQKPMVFHSIVVKSGDSVCLGQSGNEGYGKTYEQASQLTGGLIGSVCATNYSDQLKAMGQSTVDMVKSVTLQCAPLDTNGNGSPDVKVILANGGTPPSYTVDGLKLTFSTALPAGTHDLEYHCLQ